MLWASCPILSVSLPRPAQVAQGPSVLPKWFAEPFDPANPFPSRNHHLAPLFAPTRSGARSACLTNWLAEAKPRWCGPSRSSLAYRTPAAFLIRSRSALNPASHSRRRSPVGKGHAKAVSPSRAAWAPRVRAWSGVTCSSTQLPCVRCQSAASLRCPPRARVARVLSAVACRSMATIQ